MGIRSSNHKDKRSFRHFAKIGPDGTVLSTHEVAEGLDDPTDGEGNTYVEVTDLHPYDFTDVRLEMPLQASASGRTVEAVADAGAVPASLDGDTRVDLKAQLVAADRGRREKTLG